MADCAAAGQVLGEEPVDATRTLSEVPNAQAMRARIWSPRLSAGFVPQGAAAGEGYAWVDAYRSVDTRQDQGPCRVFKVDPIDGGIAGQFDLSASCGQAGRDRTSG